MWVNAFSKTAANFFRSVVDVGTSADLGSAGQALEDPSVTKLWQHVGQKLMPELKSSDELFKSTQ